MKQTGKRLGLPYYASVEALFWMGFAGAIFLSAYLAEHGFSSAVVGTIMAVLDCVGVVSAAMMGNWSDKVNAPRRIFMICAVGTAAVIALVPFGIRGHIGAVSLVFPLLFIWAIFGKPMSGLCDGWLLSVIDRYRSFSYGSIRYFGSISFALMCIAYAWAAKQFGSQDIIFFLYAAMCVVLVLVCVFARGDDGAAAPLEKGKRIGVRAVKGHYHLIVYLICHCLTNLPMYCSITFLPFKLIELTGSTASLGYVTAIRSLAEIPALVLRVYYIRKLTVRRSLMLVMIGFAVVQMMFILSGSMAIIMATMILIGLTNGAFMACQMRYVRSIAPPEAATSAITLCTSMALVSSVIGNFVGGLLVDRFGTIAYFLFAMGSALLALIIFTVSVPVGKRIGKPLPDLSEREPADAR